MRIFLLGYALAMMNSSLAASPQLAWVRLVNIESPDGHKYLLFYRDGDRIAIRDCGKISPPNKLAFYDNTNDINSICPSGEGNADIRLSLNLFRYELKRIYLLLGPPNMTQALELSLANSLRATHGPSHHQKHYLEEAARLLRIKSYIEGIGVSSPEQERPADLNEQEWRSKEQTLRDVLSGIPTFGLIRQFDASKGECGDIKSDVSKNVRICSTLPDSTFTSTSGVTWTLVARKWAKNGRFYEVWKDTQTGLLWGERLDSWYQHTNVVSVNTSGKVLRQTACESEEGKHATADLNYNFSLPTPADYEQAHKDGIGEALPSMGYYFWSSVHPQFSDLASVGASASAKFVDFRDTFGSVRCVGRQAAQTTSKVGTK